MTPGDRIRAVLAQPGMRDATHREVAEAAGTSYHTVRYVRQVEARRGHVTLTPREARMVAQAFEQVARGALPRTIVGSRDGGQLYVKLARAGRDE